MEECLCLSPHTFSIILSEYYFKLEVHFITLLFKTFTRRQAFGLAERCLCPIIRGSWIQCPARFLSSYQCRSWEAAVDGSSSWVPATQVLEMDSGSWLWCQASQCRHLGNLSEIQATSLIK